MQGLSRDQETLMKEAALEVAGTVCCGEKATVAAAQRLTED